MNHRTLFAVSLLILVGFASQARAQDKPKIERVPAKSTGIESGSTMFSTYCAVCHGPDAKGTGPAAAALKKQPANLTQLTKNNGGKFPAVKIAQMIDGEGMLPAHGSRDMPIWGRIFRSMETSASGSMTQLRIHRLSEYLESIQEK